MLKVYVPTGLGAVNKQGKRETWRRAVQTVSEKFDVRDVYQRHGIVSWDVARLESREARGRTLILVGRTWSVAFREGTVGTVT